MAKKQAFQFEKQITGLFWFACSLDLCPRIFLLSSEGLSLDDHSRMNIRGSILRLERVDGLA